MAHWAVLQLREHPDPLAVSDLERDLVARCPTVVCRFPAIKLGLLDRDNPLSAYVFVQAPAPLKLEASPYATRFLRDAHNQTHLVSDVELAQVIAPPILPPLGQLVRVTAGDWTDMEGVVVSQNCRSVGVLLELWSRKSVVDLSPTEFVVV